MSDSGGIGEEIDGEQARELLASGEACAIDARGPEEAGEGHVPGATVVSDGDLPAAAERSLHGRELPVLVFAAGDDEAREAAARLREDGVDAAIVSGGIGAFASAGGQLQPGTDEEYEGPKLKQAGA